MPDVKYLPCHVKRAFKAVVKPEMTRLARELPVFIGMMRVARKPEVITFTTTTPFELAPQRYDESVQAYQLLLCSDTDAAAIFAESTPIIPILIPKEAYASPTRCLGLASYLDILKTKDTVDMHQPDAPSNSSEFLTPSEITGPQAVAVFTSPSPIPVNCLNLQAHKATPFPGFLADNEDMNIIRTIHEHNPAGKRTIVHTRDIVASTSF
jgi:hypothetical protein